MAVSASLDNIDLKVMLDGNDAYSYMEQWLDGHPDFVQAYITKKAKQVALIRHTMGYNDQQPSNNQPPQHPASMMPGSRCECTDAPASNLGDCSPFSTPDSSTVNCTFLNSDLTTITAPCEALRKCQSEQKALDERELMYELVTDICTGLDVTILCHKILQNVSVLLNAARCSLFLLRGKTDSSGHCLASKLFDVSSHSTVEECSGTQHEVCMPWGQGVVGYVAKTGQTANVADAYMDPRFSNEVDRRVGFKTCCMLSVPIRNLSGDVIGVAQAVNKVSGVNRSFDDQDERVFTAYVTFCGIALCNAERQERSQQEMQRNQLLLDLARVIFEEQSNMPYLIHKVMIHTQATLHCEQCHVLLLDEVSHDTFSQTFDLHVNDLDNNDPSLKDRTCHSQSLVGIPGYVAATGETLNIPDASQDKRFDSWKPVVDNESQPGPCYQMDEGTDLRPQSILCMPIRSSKDEMVGVIQIVDKLDDTSFNDTDEKILEAFAIFAGIGIRNAKIYKNTVKAIAKRQVALEVLSYHASVEATEVCKIQSFEIPPAQMYHLLDYTFSDFVLDDDDTIKACIRMFVDLQLLERFHISYEVCCRWILTVKKNYRNVTYHNWRHAFNVAQTMYCALTRGHMETMLSDVEVLALLVGCLCHDLDHRGTNNQWQIKTMSPLAQLYSMSTMEHHHFDQCMMILNTPGTDILSELSGTEYQQILRLLEHAILATDLSIYFKYRTSFFKLIEMEDIDWNHAENKDLLRGMMMTACDIAAISKPWEIQKEVAHLLASEFFEQGDMEKKELNIEPVDMLNRDKKDQLPSMQVGFIDSICMPVYQAFAKFNPDLKPLLDGCQQNRDRWAMLASSSQTQTDGGKNGMKMEEEEEGTAQKNCIDLPTDNAEVVTGR